MRKSTHRYDSIESVTLLELKDDKGEVVTRVRVWRSEDTLSGCYDVPNNDVFKAVEGIHPSYRGEIAAALCKLPRVTMVEILAHWGSGVVVTPSR